MEIFIENKEKNYKFSKSYSEEIVQNIENIVTRVKGNVVLAREKGINSEHIDKPFELVKAEIIADCMDEIEREEPRFDIESIEILGDTNLSTIRIKIVGEVLNNE